MLNSLARRLLITVGKIIGFLICLSLSFAPAALLTVAYANWKYKKAVTDEIPGDFPLVIRTGNTPQIVWGSDLSTFLASHPDASFHIPSDQLVKMKAMVSAATRSHERPYNFDRSSGVPWDASFEVVKGKQGRQFFKVSATFDDDYVNVGWYEATDKQIFPKHHLIYFGPGVVLFLLPFMLVMTGTVWVIGAKLYRRYRKNTSPVTQ